MAQTANEIKNRIEWIDLAKGICMILIILTHYPEPKFFLEGGYEYDPLGLCRIPLYFFLSGIFFKTYDSCAAFIKKKFNHLLFPYITLLLIGHLFKPLHSEPNWFLFTLFATNMIGFIILLGAKRIKQSYDYARGNSGFMALLLAISIILAYCGYNCHIDQHISSMFLSKHVRFMLSGITGFPFFMAGYITRSTTNFISPYRDYNIKHALFAILCIVVVFFLSWLYGWGDSSFYMNTYMLPFSLTILTGFIGTIGILVISKQIYHIPVISYIGRYSIIVLTTHAPLIALVKWLSKEAFGFSYPQWYSLPIFIVIVLAEIPIIMFCKRYLPYLFAQKELLK